MLEPLYIGIVGAGPAGIMAALEAARCGAHVMLFDTNPMVGRKLLVTGNGRCNISNMHAAAAKYTCTNAQFLVEAFAAFGHKQTIGRLHELGILTDATPDGWCYPLSRSAATVADAFAAALDLADVQLCLETEITDLAFGQGQVELLTRSPSVAYAVDRVIIATGGKAYPALGSKGTLFPVLERLGHTIEPVYPALAPIQGDVRHLHKLQGVRLHAHLSLLEGERLIGESQGNILFTRSGISGPGAMDLSHLVSRRPQSSLTLSLDLLNEHHERLASLIARKRHDPIPMRVILGAVLPAKVPPVLLSLADLPPDASLAELSRGEVNRLLHVASHVVIGVSGTRGFRFCQLSTGGVPVTEVEPRTMASRLVPHLYLAGEVLDVVGPCGGYNLQFALTSGALAGIGAADPVEHACAGTPGDPA